MWANVTQINWHNCEERAGWTWQWASYGQIIFSIYKKRNICWFYCLGYVAVAGIHAAPPETRCRLFFFEMWKPDVAVGFIYILRTETERFMTSNPRQQQHFGPETLCKSTGVNAAKIFSTSLFYSTPCRANKSSREHKHLTPPLSVLMQFPRCCCCCFYQYSRS